MTENSQSLVPATDEPLYILCVDDEENVLTALKRLFRAEPFQVLTATSGAEGLKILRSTAGIGLILSDQRMPEMTGTAFLEAAREVVPDVPRMILTAYDDVTAAIDSINLGGALRFLLKPWNKQELLLAVRDGLQRFQLIQENRRLKDELAEWNTNLKKRVIQQTATIREKLKDLHQQDAKSRNLGETIVLMFSSLQEQRYPRLGKHSRRVAALVESMAATLKLPQSQREEFRMAGLLHDIGLLGISDRLLSKGEETMSGDEVAEYRAHAVKGQSLMAANEELQGVGLIIRHHHEEFDGGGFPDGLAGEQIPLGARLICLANFMDRTYAPESWTDAKYQLSKRVAAAMGGKFDPALSAAANLALKEVLDDLPRLRIIVEQELLLKELKIGMVLTRNLYSNCGALLAEQGTRLNSSDLGTIQLYQRSSSLNRVVYVQKPESGD